MNIPALLLLASLLRPDTLSGPPPRVEVTSATTPAAVIVHYQPAIPIVSLRVSLMADDPPGFAGAGHLLQHLHEPSLRDRVRRVGGNVQIRRSSDAIVYSVTGPAAELEYLSGVLLSALRAPSPSPGAKVIALRDLREERLAEWETAGAHVRAQLRTRLFPADLSAAGTERSSERLEDAQIPELWGELYRPDRVSVVAVGAVRLEDVQRAFAELPPRPTGRLRERYLDSVPESRLAPAEATRGWLGLAYSGSDLDPPAMSVAGRLLADHLRERLPTANVAVEHWWSHHGQALVAVVAVPESALDFARREVGTAISGVQRNLSASEVRAAATAMRREMLFHSRTPDQMAEVVGRFADRDGDPDSAQRFFARLSEVGLEEVEALIQALSVRTPIRVDVPPQPLQRP
jgi:predicted Zn-dependent peptidase